MNLDLTSLFPDLEALTPDGRWNALQDWLAKNPKYGERVERWSIESVDQVANEIRGMALDEYGVWAAFMLDSPAIKRRLMQTIELLQACYRERQDYNNQPIEKEIKNVKRQIKPSKKSGRAKSSKRTA